MGREKAHTKTIALNAHQLFDINDRKRYIIYFTIIFYVLAIYKFINGMWLFQNTPYAFRPYFDISLWLFFQTGIHQKLLFNENLCLVFDLIFYIMPFIYLIVFNYNQKKASYIALLMLLINLFYLLSYTAFPTNCPEENIAWLLTPFLFMSISISGFYIWMHALRYYFIFFFFSAAIWKIYHGGFFEPYQMTGILLEQHKNLLVTDAEGWYSGFIYWLIQNPAVGRALYIAATTIELLFFIGFITRKYDRLLLFFFCIFLIMDVLIMKIPYYEVLCLTLPLLFSKKKDSF